MISGTVNHVKFKRLSRELGLSEWETVGVLESIWMFTARSHICGDIGTSENIDIAIGIGWDKDEDELVNALIKCKWLDECFEKRLIVHDWKIHCPNHVKGNIAKHGKKFCIPNPSDIPKEAPSECPSETPMGCSSEDVPTKPSQAKPSQTKPIKQSRHAPPTLDEVIKYAQLKAIGNPAPYITRAKAAHAFYSKNMRELGATTWKDGNGNTVKNWKLKINNNWLSDVLQEATTPRCI